MTKIRFETIYCKDTKEAMDKIRGYLNDGKNVEVINLYETFYGIGFDRWLREGIADIPCEIKVTDFNKFEGYPSSYEITLNK